MAETPKDDEGTTILEGQAEKIEISDPEPAPKRARWRRHWKLWLWLFLLILIAGAGGFAYWQPQMVLQALGLPMGTPTERLAALEANDTALRDEVATLKRRLKIMEVRLGQLADVETLPERVAALEKAIQESQAARPVVEAPTPPTAPATAEAPRAPEAASADQLAILEQRLANLENTLKAARTVAAEADERAFRKAEEASARATALQAQLARRDQQIDTLSKENTELGQSVTGLAGRLMAVEKISSLSGRSAALVLAAGQLREALGQSAPFPNALNGLRSIAGEDPMAAKTLAVLEPHAETGIPTLPALTASFDPVARKVVQAAIAKEDPGWIDRALARLSGLVTIRPTGADVEGDAPTAILARGEAKLKAGDLDGAVTELSALSGAPGKAVAAWLGGAKARLAADKAVADLNRYVIGRIAQALPTTGALPTTHTPAANPAAKP